MAPNAARSGRSSSGFRDGLWPIRIRPYTQVTWIIRPSTWASGRNSRVDGSSPVAAVNTGSSMAWQLAASVRKLAWVSRQPLGRPVVPEV